MTWEVIINSSFVGSLLGTSIAGLVTFLVMKRQINFERDMKEKESLEYTLKITSQYFAILKTAVNDLGKIKKHMVEDDSKKGIYSDFTLKFIEEQSASLGILLSELDKLYNIINVKLDYFESLIRGHNNLRIADNNVKMIIEEVKKHRKTDHFLMAAHELYDSFDKNIEDMTGIVDSLQRMHAKGLKEVKRINKRWNKK